MSKADPKPGRWILPLVVLGIVGFTYVFVNAIPPAPVETTVAGSGPETTLAPGTETTTTTAAVDPVVAAFLAAVDELEVRANELLEEAQQINDDWDNEEASFSATRAAFEQHEIRVQDFAQAVVAVITPPAVTNWTAVSGSASSMATAAGNMLDGFLDPNSSAGRRSALADLQAAGEELLNGLSQARTAAGG
jgi:hypothetical protein